MKRYFVFGIVIIFAAILLEFILGLFFESPRSEIYSTVLLGGDLRFLMSIVAGVMFIEFSYETLERKGLNEYPARVSASVIFMIIYAVSDLLLKAIFNV